LKPKIKYKYLCHKHPLYEINIGEIYTTIGKNSTKFQFSTINYANVTSQQLTDMVVTTEYIGTGSSFGQGVDNIYVGNVIAFETQDGVKGILKVTADAKATATITVSVKILGN